MRFVIYLKSEFYAMAWKFQTTCFIRAITWMYSSPQVSSLEVVPGLGWREVSTDSGAIELTKQSCRCGSSWRAVTRSPARTPSTTGCAITESTTSTRKRTATRTTQTGASCTPTWVGWCCENTRSASRRVAWSTCRTSRPIRWCSSITSKFMEARVFCFTEKKKNLILFNVSPS